MNDLGITGGKIFDGFRSYIANIYIRDGRITAITSDYLESKENYSAVGKYVMPGLIDPHVHFSLSLGKYRSADDFESGSVSAAFGGITTYIDFLDPVTHENEIEEKFLKRLKEAKNSHIDYSFHMTIAHPDIDPVTLAKRTLALGINSIKTFTTYSTSNRMTDNGYILDLLSITRKYGIIETFHAEDDAIILHRSKIKEKHLPQDLPFLHPSESEASAAMSIVTMAKLTNGQAYIVHNSSGLSVQMIKQLDAFENVRLETCPQYLVLNDTLYERDDAYLYTLVPPLRSRLESFYLYEALKDGSISTVGTDHCPFTKAEKFENRLNYDSMPNGIGGVETSFVLLYNKDRSEKIINDLVRVQSVNVAETFGLKNKGKIVVGADADIAIFDPTFKWTIGISNLHTKADYTPYEGRDVIGKFVSVLSRGRFVIKDGEFVGKRLRGKFVKRRKVFWPTRSEMPLFTREMNL
ncbi:dihydroorotase [Athalassotoga saccharophila]|uniref:dihydroorotase n=1 Tax=Athalassotoga saccharophila TaxID=1441386 RepID=UPI00137B78B1|nr:amidohydrolase family protein [Athalassotoga saccharophila]BBJ28825.1 D-hydantoinase [Athalassotoga saccharophila]